MDSADLLLFILLALIVTLVSYGFDRLYAQVVPARFLYYAIRLPGVVLHEISHALGCLVCGAGIKKIVLFSQGGGSVIHAKPKIPIIGTVIISTAPLLLLPLLMAVITWVFSSFFHCSLAPGLPGEAGAAPLFRTITGIAGIFIDNLYLRFNGWFLLYLYLITSIILSLAPSPQDFRNAAAGIAAVAIACLAVIGSGHAGAISLLDRILTPMASAFTLGLSFEVIVAVASLPLVLVYAIRKEG